MKLRERTQEQLEDVSKYATKLIGPQLADAALDIATHYQLSEEDASEILACALIVRSVSVLARIRGADEDGANMAVAHALKAALRKEKPNVM